MTKDFRSYLLQHERTHFYRIKTVTPIGDFGATDQDREKARSNLTRIENAIQKYEPIAIERVKKTIIQRTPLDFVNVHNKEVFILDIELGMRISPVELQHLITVIIDAPKNHVMVYGEHDPREIDDQIAVALHDMHAEAHEKGLEPASLLTDPESSEADMPESIPYGDAYNARLLRYFNDQRDAVKGEGDDFIEDEGVVPHPDVESGEIADVRTIRRTYRDENGNLHTLTRKVDRFGIVDEI